MKKNISAKIGVFGGSGFYNFLKNVKEVMVETPFGHPSDKIAVGQQAGENIAFLPRHGRRHQFPPHRVPYLANLYAFKKLGVEHIIAPCAAGSLQPTVKPGDFVIADQFIDRTKNRMDTFFDGQKSLGLLNLSTACDKKVVHISSAEPYCPSLRQVAAKCCRYLKIPMRERGTVVVINGPRFSTKAESRFYQRQGWEVINMTQYPEAILARELEMCYVNISLITDYDAGLIGQKNIKPVTTAEVVRVFKENNEKVKKLIFLMIEKIAGEKACGCGRALSEAVIG